jgi:hypothetical protein
LEAFLKEVSDLQDLNLSSAESISPDSNFGIYIRRCIKEYESLTFDEAGEFFEEFCLFCNNDPIETLDLDLAEIYVDRQIVLLETAGMIPPSEIVAALSRLQSQLPSLYKRHYLRY